MKSYNEMAKDALRRIDEENKIILKRKKAVKRALIPALCICLAVAVSFTVKGVLDNKKGVEIEEEYALYECENAIGTVDLNTGVATSGNSAKPDNSNGNTQSNVQTSDGACIWAFDVVYDGKTYIGAEDKNASDYKAETLLGDAKDFSSYCKAQNINGKVYTVKDSSGLLLVELEDGQRVLLKEVS